MPAPKEILDLVARFDLHLDAYKSGQYNETQLRRDFLDPFFKALGWDIDNSSGHAEAYRDVIHEDAVRIEDAVKAPDYSFRVGGQRKFFLEAKKPSVHIKEDIAPAFQLRRYAWSAKLPLSVLSDFEEFAIYDCRVKPDRTDKASIGRVFYCTFREFAEKWDHIASIFSKDAILKGSFDKFAESNKNKRGTTEVDAAFLEEIEKWRADLASNLALRNKALTKRELNFAVQRIIDRIIFLRICEDRGIETYKRLHALTDKAGVYGRLCERFKEADDRYNSGLFHFKAGKDRHEPPDALTLGLDIDDKLLRDMLRGLYYPDSPYEFSVLSADILGQVYEQFLGKVIELTEGHRAKVEEKPEVRKAGGVFYTPTYIVDYIVRETVGKLLDECSRRREEAEPSGPAGNPPRHLGSYEPRAAAAVLERVSNLRILDPACGSGSFLIGAYQFLLDWHLRFYLANHPGEWAKEKKARKGSKGQHPALVQTRNGGWQLGIAERKRILLNNIFGVDLDSQAVEVTKLSLLLKVLEGEAVQSQMSLGLLDRVLPDLGDNIKCGNSLIGPDFYQQDELPALSDDDRYRLNVFDWRHEFAGIFRDGGFDAVIGNPPYIRIQRISHSESDYLFAAYQSPTSKMDLSLVFMEKALQLVNKAGQVGFICTSQWLTADYGQNLRRMLADGRLHGIVDFGSLPVFVGASTYPAIFLLTAKATDSLVVRRVTEKACLNLRGIDEASRIEVDTDTLDAKPWNLGRLDLAVILVRSKLKWKTLGDFGGAYIGCKTGLNEAFVLRAADAKRLRLEEGLLFPYALRGEEVLRYREVEPGFVVIYPYTEGPEGSPELIPEARLRKDYPRIHAHLLSFKDQLRKRQDSRRSYADGPDWYRHLRAGSFRYIRATKLVFKGIATKSSVGTLRAETAFDGARCPSVILSDIQRHSPNYFLGVLNSRLATYHLKSVCPPKLHGYIEFSARALTGFPVRTIKASDRSDQAAHDQIVKLVETTLGLHRKLAAVQTPQEKTGLERQIAATDTQIDRLVYQLYGLTEAEIALVEGRVVPESQPEEIPVPVSSASTPQSEADAAHFYAKEEPPPYRTST